MNEIKDNIKIWKDTTYPGIEIINILKTDLLSKVIYRFNIPFKLPMIFFFFTELKQNFSLIFMEIQRPTIAKAILRKKNRTGGVRIPEFKLYKRLQSSKQYGTVQKQKYKSMKQDRMPCIYSQFIFGKEGQHVQR